jgi:hypothetical protein
MVSNNATTKQKKVINLGSRQIKMIKSTCNLLDEKRNDQLHIHVNEMINLGWFIKWKIKISTWKSYKLIKRST